jgi:tetratricopeptide (TPR) repeat protein
LTIKKLPDYRLKQKILYVEQTDPQTLKEYGDLFFAEGNFSDALDFYQKATATDGLQKIKNSALESGDVMLFGRAAKALNLELKPSDWENIGKIAIDRRKYFFARHALEQASNNELLNSLGQIIQVEEHEKVS